MRILTLSLIFLFTLTFHISLAQKNEKEVRAYVKTASEKQLVELNTNFLMEGFIYYADIVVDKLMILVPESSNYNYRKGFSTLEVYKDYSKAIPFFLKAIENIDNKYDMFSVSEKSAPSDAYFYLGSCYHLNEEIDKAEEYFKKFKEVSRKNSQLLEQTNLHLLQCAEARKQMAHPVQVFINNIGGTVNSEYPDYSPVISLDGSALYFTSRRPWPRQLSEEYRDRMYNQYPEDVFVSYQDFDGEWTEPDRLKFCQPQRNEATVAVSSDERKVYLYMDSTGGGDIYYSGFSKAKFENISKLETIGVNTEYWETHAMMSHDKKRLYFVSDRPKGFGGRDIYFCNRLEDNNWSEPINMGPMINSSYDEDSPFISIDNKTLYFSSNGTKSIGGFDIMKTHLNEDGTWTISENLGYPFNSTNDDLYYTTTVDGLKGYMTSFRKNGNGEKDIYEIHNEYLGIQNVSVISGNIVSSNGKPLSDNLVIQVAITCTNCETNMNRVIYPRPRDGFYISGLEACKNYKIEYHNLGNKQIIYNDTFSTSCDSLYVEIKRDLILNPDGTLYQPIIVDTVNVVAKKVFSNPEFLQYLGFNKNKLSIEEGELKKYLDEIHSQLLEGREKVTINIYASASTVPTESFESNDLLAQKRAENIRNDLQDYFSKTSVNNKVNINILSALVQGPEYNGDSENETKYGPYQYVGMKTK